MDTSIPLNFSAVSALCSEKSRRLFSLFDSGCLSKIRLIEKDDDETAGCRLLKLLHSKKGINIHHALYLFRSIDPKEFETIVQNIFTGKRSEKAVYSITYYILLFRQDEHIKRLIADAELPLDFTASIVNSVIYRKNLSNGGGNSVLTEVLDIIPDKSLSELVSSITRTAENMPLLLHLLSKMETRFLDRYFADSDIVKEFIAGIQRLPANFIKPFFFHNPKLHGYFI